MTQIDLGFDEVRIETARGRDLPTALVVNELIFDWLVDAELTFPLTLRVVRYAHDIVVEEDPTAFDVYALDGQVLAVALVGEHCVTVRCRVEMLDRIELTRFDRSEMEHVVAER